MNDLIHPCEFCDTDLPQTLQHVTVTRQRGGTWYIFENVPARVCPNCGHRYFDIDVLEEMEARMAAAPADARPVKAWAITLKGA